MTITSRLLLGLAAVLAVAACGRVGNDPQGNPGQALREPARAVDRNPDPRIVELDLTAQPSQYEFVTGHPTTVWTYNGQLPGPLIEANAGDEVVVHFRNRLPEETTVHWHGVRVPADMDGSHLSQPPVPPGDSFEYRFTVPDAGLYWYHPHHHGSTQLALGLYGPLLVHDAGEPRFTRERVLVLSDALLDDQRQMVMPDSVPFDPLTHSLGLEGNVPLVNGQIDPVLEMAPGGRERWRIVNACTARYYQLALTGQSFHLIGADGGLADHPVELHELLLAPGERADIVVTAPGQPGSGALVALPYSKVLAGLNYTPPPMQTLMELRYSGKPVATPPLPATLATFPVPPDVAAEHFIQFEVKMKPELGDYLGSTPKGPAMADGMDAGTGDSEATFMINGKAFPDIPVITSKLGTWELWTLNNHSFSDHPFHLHGFRFLVRDIDGVPPPYQVWKDTINLPIKVTSRVNVLVDFDGQPGQWVYHCHILHHQETGMMAEVDVEP